MNYNKIKFTIIFYLFVLLLVLFQSCTKNNVSSQDPVKVCIELCKEVKGKIDLSDGPCLSDVYTYEVPDWVCDVAHWPRQDVDNNPKNQCKAYREGKAHHFVEVDPNCNFIRKY